MKKKLLLIATSLKQGGFQRVCARTAILLQDYFRVTVVLFDGRDIAYPLEGIDVIDLGIGAHPNYAVKLWNVKKRVSRLKKIKKEHQIDFAYSFGMTANLANVLSKGKEQVWVGIRSYIDFGTKSIAMVAKRADVVIACSKRIEEKCKAAYKIKNSITIYNPFDMLRIQEEAKEKVTLDSFFEKEGCLVCAMGREDDLKGYWHLLKSFSRVKDNSARLCIIGNGEFVRERQLAVDLNIADRVFFTGGKTNPFPYLRKADIYVMSSVHEGFPNALVEAMALKIPVISTDCETGPREILCEGNFTREKTTAMIREEYGILVPPVSGQVNYQASVLEPEEIEMAKAIEYLISNETERKSLGEMAGCRAGDFTNQRYTQQILRLADIQEEK